MANLTTFVREKKIYCGSIYFEADIYEYTETQKKTAKGKRSKREKVSQPKIKNLNEKNARRYFLQLVNANFLGGGYHTTLTYSNQNLPGSMEAAEREAKNYLRRLVYLKKKKGLPPLKYIIVHEFLPKRVHHHIIMDDDLSRDEVEYLWRKKDKKTEKWKPIGFANTDRLHGDYVGLGALANYLMKDPKGRKRWSCSQNLIKPEQRTNDHKYSHRKLEKLAKTQPDADYWEKQYKGFRLIPDYGYTAEYNDQSGWHITVKMIKKEE